MNIHIYIHYTHYIYIYIHTLHISVCFVYKYFLTIITKPLENYETKTKTKVTPCKGWLFFNPFQTYNELATQGDSLKLSDKI